MALTALQKKKLREKMVAKIRDKGFTKARRSYRTGKKMGEVGFKSGTAANLDQLLAEGKITQAQYNRRSAARKFAKKHHKAMHTKGTAKKVYAAAAKEGKQHEHKVQKTGTSNFKLSSDVKKTGFSNVSEVNKWQHAKQVQLKNLVRAGKMTKSRHDALRAAAAKRAKHLISKM
tara:strand:+ start:2403 stop:2924 length:522 start_codon:yes stop_codon:yes gene_type:complete